MGGTLKATGRSGTLTDLYRPFRARDASQPEFPGFRFGASPRSTLGFPMGPFS